MSDPMVIARHEAAHLCVGYLLGIEVTRATIDPKQPLVRTRCRSDELAKDERLALVALAGIATEQESTFSACAADFENAMRHCRAAVLAHDSALDGADLEIETATLFWSLSKCAVELVSDNVDLIERVAAELLQHGSLDGDAIEAILEGHR
jgi:hypothetical protein